MIKDLQDSLTDANLLIDQYVRKEGRSPLDVLEERETRLELVKLLEMVDRFLDPMDRRILELWAIDGRSQVEVGALTGLTQQAISHRIKVMPDKIARHVCEIPSFDLYYQSDILHPEPDQTLNRHHYLGYPFEHLAKSGAGGYWGERQGCKFYFTRLVCKVPEYLAGSFGDNHTVCSLCKRCTRRDAFDQGKTDERSVRPACGQSES